MDFIIEPHETLFFRTPHPYHKGEPDYIQSVFPPTPRTLQGFLRTSILKGIYNSFQDYYDNKPPIQKDFKNLDIQELIGDSEDLGELRVRGPVIIINPEKLRDSFELVKTDDDIPKWLENSDEEYITLYPKPRDILYKQDGERIIVFSLKLGNEITTDIAKMKFPQSPEEYKKEIKEYKTSGWITEEHLKSYLNEEKEYAVDILPDSLLWTTEPKTGIEIDDNLGTTKEGQIYSIEPIRLRPGVYIGFNAEIKDDNGDDLLKKAVGMQKMGGEGKLVGLSLASDFGVDIPELNKDEIKIEGNKFKIVLLTPTDFEGHWLPTSAQGEEYDNGFPVECNCCGKEVKFKILSACLDKPVGIGSRDIKTHTSSIRQCVPAGGVYYCEGDIPSDLHNCCIGENSEMGFGHIVIGKWSD